MSAASAFTSSSLTSAAYRMPPLTGSRWWLCWARQPEITSYPRRVRTGNWKAYTLLQALIWSSRPRG
jgi:hypothetical protein